MATATTKSHFHGHHPEQAKQQRRPRPITDAERAAIEPLLEKVHYSPRYTNTTWIPSFTRPLLFSSLRCCRWCSDALAECRYSDDDFEYRHVMLPKEALKVIPKDYFDTETGTLRILAEEEWRSLGITQVLVVFTWTDL
jgi:hypothetical protein